MKRQTQPNTTDLLKRCYLADCTWEIRKTIPDDLDDKVKLQSLKVATDAFATHLKEEHPEEVMYE